jgi:3-hydroxy acid dehydrogenase / malonic semialdehyde reductase
MTRIALITGATSGIGAATAKLLANNQFDIIITGRREQNLQKLKETIANTTQSKILTLCFDIQNKEDVKKAMDSLPSEWRNIDVLINNAGLASGFEPIQEGNLADWESMIDTNIKGLLYISRIVAQGMTQRKTGHIINIGSIAGKDVYASGNVYCATKSAVITLTQGMRLDLLHHGIKVSSISPGMVETEFAKVRFHGDEERASNVYRGLTPLYAEDIAETILFMVTRPGHVNIDEVLIMPTAQGFSKDTHRISE